MFRIGEFSRITRVTVDTLRHYDALGLLKPANVDPFTGYRYYSARQLDSLNRILALKEVGFSLEEIARILQEKLTNEELRGMLKAQLVRAEQEAQTAQLRRERILARLNTLDLEDKMPDYEVTLKPVDALTVVAIRETVPSLEQMPPLVFHPLHPSRSNNLNSFRSWHLRWQRTASTKSREAYCPPTTPSRSGSKTTATRSPDRRMNCSTAPRKRGT